LNFFVSNIGNAVEVTHELTANTAAFLISSDGVMPSRTSSDFDADDDDDDATNKTLPFPPPFPLEDGNKTTSSRQSLLSPLLPLPDTTTTFTTHHSAVVVLVLVVVG